MEYREEAQKVRTLIGDQKLTCTREGDQTLSHARVSRISQRKPPRKTTEPQKNLSCIKILDVNRQEKEREPEQWNRAALHAHHCCVSQKHPAFVHLQRLLLKIPPLNRRVALWKMQEYLYVARKLESFMKEQVEERPRKERQFSAFASDPEPRNEENQKEMWEEYLHAQEERLFQVRNPTK